MTGKIVVKRYDREHWMIYVRKNSPWERHLRNFDSRKTKDYNFFRYIFTEPCMTKVVSTILMTGGQKHEEKNI